MLIPIVLLFCFNFQTSQVQGAHRQAIHHHVQRRDERGLIDHRLHFGFGGLCIGRRYREVTQPCVHMGHLPRLGRPQAHLTLGFFGVHVGHPFASLVPRLQGQRAKAPTPSAHGLDLYPHLTGPIGCAGKHRWRGSRCLGRWGCWGGHRCQNRLPSVDIQHRQSNAGVPAAPRVLDRFAGCVTHPSVARDRQRLSAPVAPPIQVHDLFRALTQLQPPAIGHSTHAIETFNAGAQPQGPCGRGGFVQGCGQVHAPTHQVAAQVDFGDPTTHTQTQLHGGAAAHALGKA